MHAAALHMDRCARAQSDLPIFVATDNALLKRASPNIEPEIQRPQAPREPESLRARAPS